MAVVDKYIIDVKTQGAKKANTEMGRLSASGKKLGKSLGAAAVAYFGTQGLISAINGSIDAFAKQELAQKKLETALGKTSNALLKQAAALQQVSMFGDEDIIMMQSMLAAFVKGEEEIKQLTVATLDLASGMGIDLKNAGDLIAKTIGSSTNALSRYGIQVEGAVGSSERLETLTGNIANLFGGQAAAQTKTLTGSMEQAKNAMGDAGEAMGQLLAPVIISVSQNIKSASESLSEFLSQIDMSIRGVEEFKEADNELIVALERQAELQELHATLLARTTNVNFEYKRNMLATYKEELDQLDRLIPKLQERADIEKAQDDFMLNQKAQTSKFTNELAAKDTEFKMEMTKVQIKQVKELDKEERLYYASSLSGLRGMIKGKIQAYSAEMFAGLLSKEIASKGLVGVLTASAGAIAAGALFDQLVPQFQSGGMVGGRRHSEGGTMAELEQGEFVMSRNAVSAIGVENLNRMNQGQSGGGGSINISINGGMISPDFVENELAESIREAVRRGADFGIS